MKRRINLIIDSLSNYLAFRKGLLPLLGILLVLANWILQFFPGISWLSNTDTLLHFGIVIAIVGFMTAWAL
jgi:hypothetical protein